MRPRDVRIKPAGWALVVTAAVLMTSSVPAGVALELKARRDRQQLRVFREQSVEVPAVVTRKWQTRGENRRTWIAYEYAAGGSTFHGEVQVSRSRWNGLEVGARVPVHFAAERPDQSYLWANEPRVMPAFLPYLGGVSLLVSGGLLTLPLFRQRRLLAEGRPALATVTRHSQSQHGKVIHYEFTGLSGGRGRGQTGPSHKPPPVRSTLWVLYMSERPGRSSPYPLSLVKLAHETSLTGQARDACV